jgi:hypothetical protein
MQHGQSYSTNLVYTVYICIQLHIITNIDAGVTSMILTLKYEHEKERRVISSGIQHHAVQ